MRTIVWLLYLVFFLVITIPVLLLMKILDKRGKAERLQHIIDLWVSLWARSLCWLAGAKITVSGLENLPEGGFLIISNHQSYFDIPVLLSVMGRTFGFVAKSSVQYIPIIGSWMRRIHCVSIDRDNPRGAMTMLLNACVTELHAGHPICIFPEGTRSAGGEIKPFKKGGFVTAIYAAVPVIPVVIEGTYNLWENSPTGIRPAEVMVTFLPPLYPSLMEEEEQKQFRLTLHKMMVAQRLRLRGQILQNAADAAQLKKQGKQWRADQRKARADQRRARADQRKARANADLNSDPDTKASPNTQEPWRTTHVGNLDGDNH